MPDSFWRAPPAPQTTRLNERPNSARRGSESRLQACCRLNPGLQTAQCGAGRMIAAHAVDSPAGRRGRGAEINPLQRRGIGGQTHNWPREELPQILRAARDVAANAVGIVFFDLRRGPDAAGQNNLPKTRGKSLDLRLDSAAHIGAAAIWHVAVGPRRLFAGRSAR